MSVTRAVLWPTLTNTRAEKYEAPVNMVKACWEPESSSTPKFGCGSTRNGFTNGENSPLELDVPSNDHRQFRFFLRWHIDTGGFSAICGFIKLGFHTDLETSCEWLPDRDRCRAALENACDVAWHWRYGWFGSTSDLLIGCWRFPWRAPATIPPTQLFAASNFHPAPTHFLSSESHHNSCSIVNITVESKWYRKQSYHPDQYYQYYHCYPLRLKAVRLLQLLNSPVATVQSSSIFPAARLPPAAGKATSAVGPRGALGCCWCAPQHWDGSGHNKCYKYRNNIDI